MASKVQIAKLALQHIGDRFDIESLTEASPEAEQVNLVFDDVLLFELRKHPWNFARKFTCPAALVGTPPANWDYMYTYPPDCVKVRRIVNPLGDNKEPPLRFEIATNSNDKKVILTNVEAPEIEYTKLVTDPAQFDPEFTMAFSMRLAQFIAIPITGDKDAMRLLKALADEMGGDAQATDGNEGWDDTRDDADWILART